ncbi:uncharacterized protein [Castor canadensis]|uniref:Uncharacterized protein n=1 Tax=Castor canadensis TaxID=51338 RepID=A0AC58LE00_CASCN
MVSAAAPAAAAAAAAAAAQPPRLHEATPLRPRPWPLSRCAGGKPGRMASPLPARLWQGDRGGRADPPAAPAPCAAPPLPPIRRGSGFSPRRRRRALLQPRVPSPLLTFCRERGEAPRGGGGGRARARRRRGKGGAWRAPAEGAREPRREPELGHPGERRSCPPPPSVSRALGVLPARPRVLPFPWESETSVPILFGNVHTPVPFGRHRLLKEIRFSWTEMDWDHHSFEHIINGDQAAIMDQCYRGLKPFLAVSLPN